MDRDALQLELDTLNVSVQEQGAVVRALKEGNGDPIALKEAIALLKTRKKAADAIAKNLLEPIPSKFKRDGMEDMCKRRFVYGGAFSIYGGVAGLYDYGPVGTAIKANVLSSWRQHFVITERMLEVDCSVLTPERVLDVSGHVTRFCDLMVQDVENNEFYRADHVLEDAMQSIIDDPKVKNETKQECLIIKNKADSYSKEELGEYLKRFDVKAKTEGGMRAITHDPIDFNLMFATSIGPTGVLRGFLRPETAQGLFTNFRRLLEYNNYQLPMAAAQIGQAFRNEISPKAGLLRVREFTMAEVEYFIDPENKSHVKFASVADLELPLLTAEKQEGGGKVAKYSLGDAVRDGVIANESIGYYIGRIWLFLKRIGLDMNHVRFRQHMQTEMAHYACDCWDAEGECSYGWVEIVGCADRSAYDLKSHSAGSGVELTAQRRLVEPIIEMNLEAVFNKSVMGKKSRKASPAIVAHFTQTLDEAGRAAAKLSLENGQSIDVTVDGTSYSVEATDVTIKEVTKKTHTVNFTPSVIEPSFGIGRIIYILLEHRYWVREGDEQRSVLSLPATVAPSKVAVLPLSRNAVFTPFIEKLSDALSAKGLSHQVDESGVSIGRRYARVDEIGVPFAITVDFQSVKDDSITVRERDSTGQVRVSLEDAVSAISELCNDRASWADIKARFPEFTQQDL